MILKIAAAPTGVQVLPLGLHQASRQLCFRGDSCQCIMTNSRPFRKAFFLSTVASLDKTAVLYGGVEQKVSIFNNLDILVFDPPCVLNRNVTPVYIYIYINLYYIIWINRTNVLFRATPAFDQIQQSSYVCLLFWLTS